MPAVLLLFIALPSIHLLYLLEESPEVSTTLKITGHQWYWSYDYSPFNVSFDSYLSEEGARMLDVDNRVVLPYLRKVGLISTSTDVIHAWVLPSPPVLLGITLI